MLRLLLCAFGALAFAATPAMAATASGETVIAVIDTGINPGHRAFDADQVVAWWDFTRSEPAPGQSMDPARGPFDDNGHGTGTAAMAAARTVHPDQSPSVSPGAKLAIARVFEDGQPAGDVAAAIRWAVDTAHADVINISIGSIVPLPLTSLLFDEYAELERAHRKGVLVMVANGNGVGNTGVTPGDGAAATYGSSRFVLSVGASGPAGAHHSYQPEVAADNSVTVPVPDKPEGVQRISGTSFSSPFVAGFAARLVTEIRATGRRVDATYLETLVKYSAQDTAMPPLNEGYGQITAAQLTVALAHARAGTLPERPNPDLSGMYVEQVAGAERDLNDQTPAGTPEPDPEPGARPEPGGSPSPGSTPAPGSSPSPTGAPRPAPAATRGPARVSAIRVRRRTLSFRVNHAARVTVTVFRGQRRVRRIVLDADRGTTRVRLGRLARGAHRVKVAVAGGRTHVAAFRVRTPR